jgi:serine-type D-Ala-D-Ala carboxypeptidase/endopeptidase (penicillin-binding protein 4)
MMKKYLLCVALWQTFLFGSESNLPKEFHPIMDQPKYSHAFWGLYVKDLQTGKELFNLNADKLFSPASTTKLFSIAALLNAFGDDYRFKTPLYATGPIENGILQGNLVLVGQGDLTLGGREPNPDTLAFTKLDHIIANEVPGVILTKEDPLTAINTLATQVFEHGVREIRGDILIDDRLFETTEKRGMILSPVMINENLIDIVINPAEVGRAANICFRPQVPSYKVINEVKTVGETGPLDIQVNADSTGKRLIIQGTIPVSKSDIVRTFPILDPKSFAKEALMEALKNKGITMKPSTSQQLPHSYDHLNPLAFWTSPPLSEYAKLILKVSHNLGADLVPLLLASHAGQKTFDQGMRLLGNFVTGDVKISPDAFVFIDAAGGNDNRATPKAELQLLSYMHQKSASQFRHFFNALPILGVDGSLEDFGKQTKGAGKIRAKTGTGASYNLATGKFFLTTQALAGYIEGKNGHLLGYMLVVNNAAMPSIDDVFAIFEDESELSSLIYEQD